MFKNLAMAGATAAAATLFAGAAMAAQTATANLTVTAVVADACSVTGASLDFGTVSPSAGTTLPTIGTINVTCTLGTSYTVGLGDGQNLSGTRRMKRGANSDYLAYEIYRDALGLNRFGDANVSDRASGLGTGPLVIPIALYGQIPSGQSTASGAYSDTVQITVYY